VVVSPQRLPNPLPVWFLPPGVWFCPFQRKTGVEPNETAPMTELHQQCSEQLQLLHFLFGLSCETEKLLVTAEFPGNFKKVDP
jgi:hypothetical protein